MPKVKFLDVNYEFLFDADISHVSGNRFNVSNAKGNIIGNAYYVVWPDGTRRTYNGGEIDIGSKSGWVILADV